MNVGRNSWPWSGFGFLVRGGEPAQRQTDVIVFVKVVMNLVFFLFAR